MKKIFLSVVVLVMWIPMFAQKEINVSQYMLNRYTINSAFGGSHDALSLLGSYRQKWSGINRAPSAQFFSAHAPLKNESVGLGIEVFSQNYSTMAETGFAGSYTYRVRPTTNSWLAFSLSGGMAFSNANWGDIDVKDTGDAAFVGDEKRSIPVVGLATAWYGKSFFAGLSIPNFFYYDIASNEDAAFNPGNSQYLLTGGYTFQVSNDFKIQPSTLLIINRKEGTFYDLSGSVIYKNMLWVGATYRSTDDIVGMVAFQVIPQLRLAYSLDYSTGELKGYNNGTHEFSLQFNFGYKVKTSSPKFF